jgi:hypothetical protein
MNLTRHVRGGGPRKRRCCNLWDVVVPSILLSGSDLSSPGGPRITSKFSRRLLFREEACESATQFFWVEGLALLDLAPGITALGVAQRVRH